MSAGKLPKPPALETLDIDGVEVEPGRVLFEMTLGCAVQSRLPAGTGYTAFTFLRAVTVDTGTIRCEAVALNVGRTATATATIVDLAGKLFGHATTTCLVLPTGDHPTAGRGTDPTP